MRTLPPVRPTPEQLSIVSKNHPGVELIRGAAGSGKTTTALLKLRSLIGVYLNRKRRLRRQSPVRILVLTFNRTLRGYIEALAEDQASDTPEVDLQVMTFGNWARELLGNPEVIGADLQERIIRGRATKVPLPLDFAVDEAEYLLGRFLPNALPEYVTARREGRGTAPRLERPVREALLQEVVYPYTNWKRESKSIDWNDVAVAVHSYSSGSKYDVIIVDEAQDFSANQIRAVVSQLADPVHSLIFVLDTAQRIYARGYSWQEVGVKIRSDRSHRLGRNYRNTAEIAHFAASLIRGLPADPDATLPNFDSCLRRGPKPIVMKGRYAHQLDRAIEFIRTAVDLKAKSVAFLHPLGGGWFDYTRTRLRLAGLRFAELSRQNEWPRGDENIGLSTLASAKGLEFDHVFLLGLNAEVLAQAEQTDDDDERLTRLRRLLAMGVGRAKETVTLGFSPEDVSRLTQYFDSATYEEVVL